MSSVLLGHNRFIECGSILAYKGTAILKVVIDPLRVELTTPEGPSPRPAVRIDQKERSPADRVRVVETSQSFAIFWNESALAIATLLDPCTVHLKLDLRPLGIEIYDDVAGLHVGGNVFSANEVNRAATAISLGD